MLHTFITLRTHSCRYTISTRVICCMLVFPQNTQLQIYYFYKNNMLYTFITLRTHSCRYTISIRVMYSLPSEHTAVDILFLQELYVARLYSHRIGVADILFLQELCGAYFHYPQNTQLQIYYFYKSYMLHTFFTIRTHSCSYTISTRVMFCTLSLPSVHTVADILFYKTGVLDTQL